ncbi:MAG: GtrA family protein [Synergistaceae bacterium]|nr:GtrA family protein [Synergistaceae bacterium]
MNFRQLILYGIFGVLSTLIDILMYWAVSRAFGLSIVASTVTAWFTAVLFAYWSNRKYVFRSRNNSVAAMFFEALYFFMCRIATGLLDVVIMYVFADLFGLNDVIVKTVSNIIVIILNFVASKLFIFREGKKS